MNKICTSIEQSKKLVELGIDINTADLAWYESYGGYSFRFLNKEYPLEILGDEHDEIPAWSLTVLLGLMPNLDSRSPVLCRNMQENKWWMVYHSTAIDKAVQTKCYENPLEAAFEMICWLLENKKI